MKKLFNVVIVILVLLIIINIGLISYKKYYKNRQVMIDTEEVEKLNLNDDLKTKYKNIRNYYGNSDIKARLIIDNLEIDNYVTQAHDNKYYMNHDLHKKYEAYGNMFIDFRTDLENGKKINIYGHNSRYRDVPFSRLKKYLDKSYYEDNKYIYLETEKGLRKFQIFAVYGVFKSDNEHMLYDYNTVQDWNKHFNSMKNKSLYETDVEVSGDDTVLTIQTCLYNNKSGKYLVINSKEVN